MQQDSFHRRVLAQRISLRNCYLGGSIQTAGVFSSRSRYCRGRLTSLTRTDVLPLPMKPRRSAAALETSRRRPATFGPRSFTRKTRDRLFLRLVTSILEPRGKVRWAAVRSFLSKTSPLAVTPLDSSPYQVATPNSWLSAALRVSSVKVVTVPLKRPCPWSDSTKEAGGPASDWTVKATRTASPQPIISFPIQPPSTVTLLPSKKPKLSLSQFAMSQGDSTRNTKFCRKCQPVVSIGAQFTYLRAMVRGLPWAPDGWMSPKAAAKVGAKSMGSHGTA